MRTEEVIHKSGRKTIFVYDKDNCVIERYFQDGKETTISYYQYDKNGNKIEIIIKQEDGKQVWKLFFIYDEKNRKVELHEFNKENLIVYKNYYDYNNPNGKIHVKIFDKNDNLIEESLKNSI